MAVKKETATAEQATVEEPATKTAAEEKKFPIEKLAANCRKLFGVSSSTFAGATAGMTGKYSVAEMKAHIEKWGRTEAK